MTPREILEFLVSQDPGCCGDSTDAYLAILDKLAAHLGLCIVEGTRARVIAATSGVATEVK